MTMPNKTPPQYAGQPVILVHLTVDDTHSSVAWCAPYTFILPDPENYPGIPRVLCPACAKAKKR